MKFQVVFVLLLLTCVCLSLAQGSYGNCCLRHARSIKAKVRRNIESYRMQETDGDCNISAVVFRMKKRSGQTKASNICANPNDLWVKELVKEIDQRNGQN